jgi:D-sedoheptulose 7-phosphate isomerase
MGEDMRDSAAAVLGHLAQARDAVQAAIDDEAFVAAVAASAEHIADALAGGGKLLIAGNGGSAADAQHIVGEFIGRMHYDRAPAAALALTTDSAVLTGLGNDYGYERVFERQVLALGRAGDVFLALSTSGRSPNVLRAADAARRTGLYVIGFTGRSGGDLRQRCDLCLQAPSDTTPIVQQLHLVAAHIVCGFVEARLFPKAGGGAS